MAGPKVQASKVKYHRERESLRYIYTYGGKKSCCKIFSRGLLVSAFRRPALNLAALLVREYSRQVHKRTFGQRRKACSSWDSGAFVSDSEFSKDQSGGKELSSVVGSWYA